MVKTSVIEVRDMLPVLSAEELARRIRELPGVESVTVDYAAGSAAVRYDETRLEIADIKAAVRQHAHGSAAPESAPAMFRARSGISQAPGKRKWKRRSPLRGINRGTQS